MPGKPGLRVVEDGEPEEEPRAAAGGMRFSRPEEEPQGEGAGPE